jgi:hypothetical protein
VSTSIPSRKNGDGRPDDECRPRRGGRRLMPTAPPRPCATHPGILLTRGIRCPLCAQAYDGQRPEHFRFYTSRAWRTLRAWVLEQEPICACGQPTTDVDHVLPRRTHPHLELVRSNLHALCHACHAQRTADRPR